jgi:hypothetical protein
LDHFMQSESHGGRMSAANDRVLIADCQAGTGDFTGWIAPGRHILWF